MDYLNERMNEMLEGLDNLVVGSEERRSVIEDIATLHKLILNEKTEYDETILKDEENQIKREQIEEQKKDRKVKVAIAAATLGFYGIWMIMGFNFEKNGSFCSKTFSNLTNKFKPTNML